MTDIQNFLDHIREADKVLVGIGEEFDRVLRCETKEELDSLREYLENVGRMDVLPGLLESDDALEKVSTVLEKLQKILTDKDYYVVSTAMNRAVKSVPWKENRLVMPCGGIFQKQCSGECREKILLTNAEEIENIQDFKRRILAKKDASETLLDLGSCDKCSQPFVFNNVYAKKYNENGYLGDWKLYEGWLQRTLNRKIVILELGVGLDFPSVIRWPFEKIAFYNNKASFYRVNKTLYQLPPELQGKGTSIAQNAIDWLASLC